MAAYILLAINADLTFDKISPVRKKVTSITVTLLPGNQTGYKLHKIYTQGLCPV